MSIRFGQRTIKEHGPSEVACDGWLAANLPSLTGRHECRLRWYDRVLLARSAFFHLPCSSHRGHVQQRLIQPILSMNFLQWVLLAKSHFVIFGKLGGRYFPPNESCDGETDDWAEE